MDIWALFLKEKRSLKLQKFFQVYPDWLIWFYLLTPISIAQKLNFFGSNCFREL